MRMPLILATAALIGLGGSMATASPAAAAMALSPQPLVGQNVMPANAGVQEVQYRPGRYHRHRGWRGPRYSYRHRGWHGPRSGYRYRHHRRDRGRAAAAGIIGLGLGAMLGQALTPRTYYPRTYAYAGMPTAHVRWCQQRYRSYDVRTDTFLSYDGNRYRCNSPYVR